MAPVVTALPGTQAASELIAAILASVDEKGVPTELDANLATLEALGLGFDDTDETRAAKAAEARKEGLAAFRLGDLVEAAMRLRNAAAENQRDALNHLYLAEVLSLQGNPTAARVALQNAIVLSPRRPESWAELAASQAAAGQHPAAVRALAVAFHLCKDKQTGRVLLTVRERAAKNRPDERNALEDAFRLLRVDRATVK